MKKILIISLFPLILCGCKNKEDKDKTDDKPEIAPPITFVDYLSFVNTNKFYLDINVDSKLTDLEIRLNGTLLNGGQQYSFSDESEFTVNGNPVDESVNIFAVYLNGEDFSCDIFQSVFASSFSETVLNVLDEVKTSDKSFVCITTINDGWNHNLNNDLNNYINISKGSID